MIFYNWENFIDSVNIWLFSLIIGKKCPSQKKPSKVKK